MDNIINIFFYVLTGVGVLTTVVVFFNDIRFDEKKFVWYYYVPCAVINIVLGALSPLVFSAWLMYMITGSDGIAVFWVVLWALVVLANNIVYFVVFFKKKNFGKVFYISLSLTSLFIISYWMIRIFY